MGIAYRSNELGQDIPLGYIDGDSTFFIFVAGSFNEVAQYSEKLAQEFNSRSINYENVIFLNAGFNETPSWNPEYELAREINNDNSYALVNCIPLNASNIRINLKRWEQKPDSTADSKAVPIDIKLLNIYRLGQRSIAQYFAGLPVQIDHINFDYNIELSTRQYMKSKSQSVPGNPSEFIDITRNALFSSPSGPILEINVPETRRSGEGHPLFIAIKIDNANINSGFYHVNYQLVQKAKVPDWVAERSVPTRDELTRSINYEKRIRVIGFDIIYRNIVNAYNLYTINTIYSGDVYFVK